jgi:hypothetical protein
VHDEDDDDEDEDEEEEEDDDDKDDKDDDKDDKDTTLTFPGCFGFKIFARSPGCNTKSTSGIFIGCCPSPPAFNLSRSSSSATRKIPSLVPNPSPKCVA